jgi:hypothetical protein
MTTEVDPKLLGRICDVEEGEREEEREAVGKRDLVWK